MVSLRLPFAFMVTTLLLFVTHMCEQLLLGAPRSLFSPCSETFHFSIPFGNSLSVRERRRVGAHCSHTYNLNASLLRGGQVFEEQPNKLVELEQPGSTLESLPMRSEKGDSVVTENSEIEMEKAESTN